MCKIVKYPALMRIEDYVALLTEVARYTKNTVKPCPPGYANTTYVVVPGGEVFELDFLSDGAVSKAVLRVEDTHSNREGEITEIRVAGMWLPCVVAVNP